MKSIKDIMSELGFDRLGNEDTQKAFIKHLIREANRLDGSSPNYVSQPQNTTKATNAVVQNKTEVKAAVKTLQEQLCFDLDSGKQVS